MPADALTTKENVKQRLGIEHDDLDDLIDRLILAVSARIGAMCNRVFGKATYSEEIHDGCDTYGSRRRFLIVENGPISALTALEYNAGTSGTTRWEAIAADSYTVDHAAGIIAAPGGLPAGARNIRVTYEGGYETLPLELSEVCEAAVVRIFKKRESEGRKSEQFQESSITWADSVFTEEDRATIRKYRRGYNL